MAIKSVTGEARHSPAARDRTYQAHRLEDELKQLMARSLQGDSKAYTRLLRATLSLLTSYYSRKLGGRSADVDDLVQETLLSIHTRRTSYDPGRPFTPWLFAIARYRMIDFLRSRRVFVEVENLDDILRDEGFQPASDARMDVDRLLSALPGKQASAIRRTHLEGRSTAEVAAIAGISQSDVKISVHRGLKHLTKRLTTAAA